MAEHPGCLYLTLFTNIPFYSAPAGREVASSISPSLQLRQTRPILIQRTMPAVEYAEEMSAKYVNVRHKC